MRVYLTQSIFADHDIVNSLVVEVDRQELLVMVNIAKKNNLDLVILNQEEY